MVRKITAFIIGLCMLLVSTTVWGTPNAVPPPNENHDNRVILPWSDPSYETMANNTSDTETIEDLKTNIDALNTRTALQFFLLILFVLCLVVLVFKRQQNRVPNEPKLATHEPIVDNIVLHITESEETEKTEVQTELDEPLCSIVKTDTAIDIEPLVIPSEIVIETTVTEEIKIEEISNTVSTENFVVSVVDESENQNNTFTPTNDIVDDNLAKIKDLIYNKNKIKNILLKVETIDENLLIGYVNPYTNQKIQTLNDIHTYLYELYPELKYSLNNEKSEKNRKKLNKLKHQNRTIKLPLATA